MTHTAPHPKAGQTVTLTKGPDAGKQFKIQDWFDRVTGGAINNRPTNSMTQPYFARGNPDHVDVVVGTLGNIQIAVHASELPA
jgi:hypothetical protein